MAVFVSTTFSENGSSVIDAVKQLAENGITHVELGSIHKYEEELIQKLKDIGGCYVTHNFFPPQDARLVLNIGSQDEKIRQDSVAFIKKAIDFAQAIGARIYTVHPGFIVDPKGESLSSGNYDFNFDVNAQVDEGMRKECEELSLGSLSQIAGHAHGKNVTVALETQGSISKKDFLLFSRPQDFTVFLKRDDLNSVGINLNLGHLHLASKAWGFKAQELIDMLKPRVVAVEVSHNEGQNDDHAALHNDAWYWDILKDDFLKSIPVIFEGRNIGLKEVARSFALLRKIL